ncbi:hypothetical protein ACIQGZ_26380 [Streptomyces sp. NPDC092296]|uniref:hypothetical protein n=1 Tax=Streptomyces sp. NPDC092296 TaxID=3366012 RepID=UPI0037F85294
MPITDDLKKTLTDPTPLYALAGVGELAYAKLREVPGKVEEISADRKGAQERAAARLQEAQARLVEAQAKVTETVSTLPTDFKVLQERAQGFALQQVGRAAEFAVKAKEVYDDLAERGKVAVERSRRETARQIEEKGATFEAKASAVADGAVVRFADAADEVAETLAPKEESAEGRGAAAKPSGTGRKPAAANGAGANGSGTNGSGTNGSGPSAG